MTNFPFPFGGITQVAVIPEDKMAGAVEFMAHGCGQNHRHNVAVQFDGNKIWTSELGIDCLQRYMSGDP